MFEKLNTILDRIASAPAAVVDFFTDPIWALGGTVAMVVAGCLVGAWFFPKLRPYFGVGALTSLIALVSFRKGQKAEAGRRRKEIEQLQKQLRDTPTRPHRNWWDR